MLSMHYSGIHGTIAIQLSKVSPVIRVTTKISANVFVTVSRVLAEIIKKNIGAFCFMRLSTVMFDKILPHMLDSI